MNWTVRSDDIGIALFTLKVSLSFGVKLDSLALEYSKSYEPSSMTSCEVETSPSVAVELSKSNIWTTDTWFAEVIVLSTEELGSRSTELICILLLHSYPESWKKIKISVHGTSNPAILRLKARETMIAKCELACIACPVLSFQMLSWLFLLLNPSKSKTSIQFIQHLLFGIRSLIILYD